MSSSVESFAPASIGNLGVGFDMLGLALAGIGDKVIARRSGGSGVTIAEILDVDGKAHTALSTATDQNTASIAAQALWDSQSQAGGVELRIHKGVPLKSGMGSSAASAVAGVMAVNELLEVPLGKAELLRFAIEGEKFASGGIHADNVAPSLLGGLVFCPAVLLPETVLIKPPSGVLSVLLHPDLQVATAAARKGLESSYPMELWLAQQAYLAGFIAACEQDDHSLLKSCLKDVVVEPQRAALVPCLGQVQTAALDCGAFGSSLSGSGPSIFALCREDDAPGVAAAMEAACREAGHACRTWISRLDAPGATVAQLT